MLIDTHAHLYVDDYNGDLSQVVQQAIDNKVAKVLLPNIDTTTIRPLKKITQNYSFRNAQVSLLELS